MNFEFAPEFEKDLKRLAKKWRSLPEDIEYAKPSVESLYAARDDIDIAQYRTDFFASKKAAILYTKDETEVVKMRLDVESLGTNSKARMVFVAARSKNSIMFIELYAKNEKDREDKSRIKKYT